MNLIRYEYQSKCNGEPPNGFEERFQYIHIAFAWVSLYVHVSVCLCVTSMLEVVHNIEIMTDKLSAVFIHPLGNAFIYFSFSFFISFLAICEMDFLMNRRGPFNTDVLSCFNNSRPTKICILELLNAKPINENVVINTTRNPHPKTAQKSPLRFVFRFSIIFRYRCPIA